MAEQEVEMERVQWHGWETKSDQNVEDLEAVEPRMESETIPDMNLR